MRRLAIKKFLLQTTVGWVGLALLCWLAAIGLYYGYIPSKWIDDNLDRQIQSRTQKAMLQATELAGSVRRSFQSNHAGALNALQQKYDFPFYVFKDTELFYWSDFSFVPAYEQLRGNYNYRLFNFSRGIFIVHRSVFTTGGKARVETFVLIPLYWRYPVENQYLHSGFNTQLIPVQDNQDIRLNPSFGDDISYVFASDGQTLFSYSILPEIRQRYNQENQRRVRIGLVCMGMLLLGIVWWQSRHHWISQRMFELYWLGMWVYVLGCRLVMMHYRWLSVLFTGDLFDPKVYASSYLAPSLGDFLLNALLLVWLFSELRIYLSYTHFLQHIGKTGRLISFLLATVLSVVSYACIGILVYFIHSIYIDSAITLDLHTQIQLSLPHTTALLIVLLLSHLYFILTDLITRLFARLHRQRAFDMMASFSLSTLCVVIISYFVQFYHPWVIFLHGLFFLIVVYSGLNRHLFQLRYRSILYLFLAAVLCAAIATYAIDLYSQKRIIANKLRYGENLLAERDLYTEFLLQETYESIRQDIHIQEHMRAPFLPKQVVRQRIRRVHLHNKFDNYQVKIFLFDAEGYAIDEKRYIHIQDYLKQYANDQFRTEKAHIYFISEQQAIEQKLSPNLLRAYVLPIGIQQEGMQVGYVVLELKQKKDQPYNVYPELMIDSRFQEESLHAPYSYAVWIRQQLKYSYGSFNYEKHFSRQLLTQAKLYSSGINHQGFHHIGVLSIPPEGKQEPTKVVVVSSPTQTLSQLFANFSFLLITLILYGTFVFLILAGKQLKMRRLSFTAKIQLYLNLGFFVPLVIVSGFTLSFIKNSYDEDLMRTFLQQAQNAMLSLSSSLQLLQSQQIQLEELQQELSILSRYAQLDLNLYSPQGRLITSSQPGIFENGLLSYFINPLVISALKDEQYKHLLLEEQIGRLHYQAVYVAIKSFEDGQLIGILNIPFFTSGEEQTEKIVSLLSIVLNIFTINFACFLFISHWASHRLTVPLQLITQKLRKVSFQNYNEPLEWDSEDEIGLLVNEYNRMLLNLEHSKQTLAQSEKESAWREFAKQVAHEIKNPLTPMKISLQQLERRIQQPETTHEELKRLLQRTLRSLLQQVDTLSDIASSFSTLAKMPSPQIAPFDLADVLRNTVELHRSQNQMVFFVTHIAPGSFTVMGDAHLMGRILTNLILNAIQAVPESRTPQIMIALYRTEQNKIRLEVRDNGNGIPASIRSRIFTPSFTTKASGSGIGLAVALRGIEQMQGNIWFETEEGKGTCFFIELPPMASYS